MDEFGEADWATDKYCQLPPTLSAINDNGTRPVGRAEVSKNREEFGEPSGKNGNRKQKQENPPGVVTAPAGLNKMLFATCLTVVVAAVGAAVFFIYRTDAAKSLRIAAQDAAVAEETVRSAEEDRAAAEAEKEARVAVNSSEADETSRAVAEAAEAALVTAEAAEAAEETRVAAEIAKAAEEARVAEEEKKEEARVAAEAGKAAEDPVSDAAIVSSARAAAEAAEQASPRPTTASGESGKSATTDRLERDCNMCRTPCEALMLIAEYRSKHGLDGRWKSSVDRIELQWQDRFDQRLVRLGTKWCTVVEQQAAALESQILVEEAIAKIRVNDFEGARVNLEKASSVDKNGYLANYLLGLHFALQNDSDTASSHFKKVLARSPRHTGAMNNLAVCEVKDGKVSTAITHLERAAVLAPTSSEIIHNVGRCVFEFERKHITASNSVVERYRKLNSRLAPAAGSSPRNGFIWLLTPPVAPAEARPRNAGPNEVANLVKIGGEGSGFFVAANLIITNRHVVENETYGMADAIYVSIPAGDHKTSVERAEVIAVSDEHDLALLRCQTLDLPPLVFSVKSLNPGQPVMALGYPNTSSVMGSPLQSTHASVGSMLEKSPDTVLYDVVMNPGNSGGPLLDATGRVAGINTFIFLLDRGVSGGVQANSALSFLEEHILGFLASRDESNERSWPEIASSGAASTVFIEVFFNDAVPVLAAKAGTTRMQGYYFVDDSCLSCKGSGRVPCPSRTCHGGTMTQKSSISRIIGFGDFAREVQIPTSKEVDCPNCVAGAVTCPACRGSGKARN